MKVFVVQETVYDSGERQNYVRGTFSTQKLAEQYISDSRFVIRVAHTAQALNMGIDPEEWITHDASKHRFTIYEFILDSIDGTE